MDLHFDQGPVRPRPIFTVIAPCVESGILQKRYTGKVQNLTEKMMINHDSLVTLFFLCLKFDFTSTSGVTKATAVTVWIEIRRVQTRLKTCDPQTSRNGRCLLKPAFGEKAMEGGLKGRFYRDIMGL